MNARFSLLITVFFLAACKPSPPEDLREWRASDHSQEPGEGPGAAVATPEDHDPMVAALGLWGSQCASCHGRSGRGDGPQSAMFRTPDMSTEAFQSSHTDDELAGSITRGKNMMPPFGASLRPEAIPLLVRLVRSFRTPR